MCGPEPRRKLGRPPRDRAGEDAAAEAALEHWLRGGRQFKLSRQLTPEEEAELRVQLGGTFDAVDTILSLRGE